MCDVLYACAFCMHVCVLVRCMSACRRVPMQQALVGSESLPLWPFLRLQGRQRPATPLPCQGASTPQAREPSRGLLPLSLPCSVCTTPLLPPWPQPLTWCCGVTALSPGSVPRQREQRSKREMRAAALVPPSHKNRNSSPNTLITSQLASYRTDPFPNVPFRVCKIWHPLFFQAWQAGCSDPRLRPTCCPN